MFRTHNQPCAIHKGQTKYGEVFLVGEHFGEQQWLCWPCLLRILRTIEVSPRVIEKVKVKWQK